MRLMYAVAALVSLSGCQGADVSSLAQGSNRDFSSITAIHLPESESDVATRCEFFKDRVLVSAGPEGGAVSHSVDMPIADQRAIARLTVEAYENEIVDPPFPQEGPAGDCRALSYVQVNVRTQSAISSAGIFGSSPCKGFAGQWREGPASDALIEIVKRYCPAALTKH